MWIFQFSKLRKNLLWYFFKLPNFQKFVNYEKLSKLWNFHNWIVFVFTNLKNSQSLLIKKIWEFKKYQICEIIKILKKLLSFGIVRLFDISHYSQFRQFSYLLFDINLFLKIIWTFKFFIIFHIWYFLNFYIFF